MKNTIVFISLFLPISLFSQNISRQVIGSTGNASSSGPYVLHSTVGQPPLAGTTMPQSSLTGYTYILRQGFQQPFKFHNLWISSVSNNDYTHTTIFPNPCVTKVVTNPAWGINRKFDDLKLHNIFFSKNYKDEFNEISFEKNVPCVAWKINF